ncbi:MAG: hypothetical protein ACK4SV_13715 [Hyphomonas sp.]
MAFNDPQESHLDKQRADLDAIRTGVFEAARGAIGSCDKRMASVSSGPKRVRIAPRFSAS